MPRSLRSSSAHSTAVRTVASSSAAARCRGLAQAKPPAPPPSTLATRWACSTIVASSARCPAVVTRSRCRASRTTSRRVASRTSAVVASCGWRWRTAAVSTAGTPQASASPSRWAACPVDAGVPGGPPWSTTSMASAPAGSTRCQACSRSRATSGRRASSAAPTSEVGPSRTSRGAGSSAPGVAACRAIIAAVATASPRSPVRCTSLTSRHSRAQPTPCGTPAPAPRASTVTRG